MLSSSQVYSIIDQISNNVLTKKLVDDLVIYFKQRPMTSDKERQLEQLFWFRSRALHRNTFDDDPRIKELNARTVKLLDFLIKRILNEVELSEKAQLSAFDKAMDLEEQKAILERYLLKNPKLLIYSMGKSIETSDFKLKEEIENIIIKRRKSEINDKYIITSLVSVYRIVKTKIIDTKGEIIKLYLKIFSDLKVSQETKEFLIETLTGEYPDYEVLNLTYQAIHQDQELLNKFFTEAYLKKKDPFQKASILVDSNTKEKINQLKEKFFNALKDKTFIKNLFFNLENDPKIQIQLLESLPPSKNLSVLMHALRSKNKEVSKFAKEKINSLKD